MKAEASNDEWPSPWLPHCRATEILTSAARYQLERLAYFGIDPRDSNQPSQSSTAP